MARILVVYSSTDGHTLEICQRLQAVLELQSHRVTLWPLADGASLDLVAFDKIVLGASIRYGSHGQQVLSFARHNAQLLGSKPSAFFSVNLVARKREKCWPQSNPYLLKFLRQISWQPTQLAVFAGKIDYPKYGVVDRIIIRLIMWMTHGPTQPDAVVDFTDWQQVEAFGQRISAM